MSSRLPEGSALLVHEHTTGGGLARARLPAGLLREGRAMRDALIEDALRAGVSRVVVTHDDRVPLEVGDRILPLLVRSSAELERRLLGASADVDAVIVVAPEIGGSTTRLVELLEAAGAPLAGGSTESTRVASDKIELARWLERSGVPVVPCYEARPGLVDRPFVLRPRDGAGSTDIRLVSRGERIPRGETRCSSPLHEGLPASVLCLCGPCVVLPLRPTLQRLSEDGRFRYLGGAVPLTEEDDAGRLEERAVALALQAVRSLPGTRGFWGVDLVLAPDGDDRVVEVNPRLTTSYCGLRASTTSNLLAAALRVARGVTVESPAWSPQALRFDPDGRVRPLRAAEPTELAS